MKVIIYGAGAIGYGIASYLAAEENDITVIDEDPSRVSYVAETLDVRAVLGRASYPDVLEKVGAHEADALIAVSSTDELNLMACQMAYTLFNVPRKIAHIRGDHYLNPAWTHMYNPDNVPVDFVISPEKEVAQRLMAHVDVPGTTSCIDLENDLLSILGVYCRPDFPLANRTLASLGEALPDLPFRVLCILRDGVFLIPGAEDCIRPGDEIYVAVEKKKRTTLLSAFGVQSSHIERVVVVGAGAVGLSFAKTLLQEKPEIDLALIEKNQSCAHKAADLLEGALVICGDALDTKTLKEASISSADMVVSVTENDEANVLTSLLSKNLRAPHAVALVNNHTYPRFLPSLGVDAVLSPGELTVAHILKHLRYGRHLKSLHLLQGGFGEVLETTVSGNESLIGEPFKIFNVPGRSILGGIVREGAFMIPRSTDRVMNHDHLIVLAVQGEVTRIEKLLKGKE